MQQAVRESVAAVFESMMSSEENAHVISNIHVMRTVLQAGGSTVKDVADWIRAEPKLREVPPPSSPPPMPYTSKAVGTWKPAPKAKMPLFLSEESACDTGLDYVRDLVFKWGSALTPKEQEFLVSISERFEERKQWLTIKQLAWLDLIARRVGHPTIM